MRELLIQRLRECVQCYPRDFGRWAFVNKQLSEQMGGMQKFGKRGLKEFDVTSWSPEFEQHINGLDDYSLVSLFEDVIRSYNQQRG